MINRRKPILLLLCMAYFSACSVGGSGGGEDEPEPVPVEFNVSISPQNSGRVNLGSQSFESGDTVTVRAEPFKGFAFSEWTGGEQSSNNPFSFVIRGDTDLVANFIATSSDYQVNFLVSDTTDTLDDLTLGLREQAADGIDELDVEMPPPPAGGLHAYFSNSVDLAKDYRSATASSATWDMQLQPGQGDSLFFSWQLQANILNGSLSIRNEEASIDINMEDETELAVHIDDVDHLTIEYQLGNE